MKMCVCVCEKVGAALRPAFGADAPPDVTVKACQVIAVATVTAARLLCRPLKGASPRR